MTNKVVLSGYVAALTLCCLTFAQTPSAQQSGPVNAQKSAAAPAPVHDLSGTWEPANGPKDGVQANGVKAMPSDGKPEHTPPFTPYGLKVFQSHKPLEGYTAVLPGFYNDPRDACDPLGFPRINFYSLRETQIMQNEYKIMIAYAYAETWRAIWTDGRTIKPVDGGVMMNGEFRESRWYGYSVGKWVDDTTFVDETWGMEPEDKVWLDTAGRPISDQLHVAEQFHRVNHDRLELTETIDDPKMYTKPWVAMNKFPMKLEDPHTDIEDMYCSPTEMQKYNKIIANPASGKTNE
jgi:hypothetical protein